MRVLIPGPLSEHFLGRIRHVFARLKPYRASGCAPLDDAQRLAQLQLQFQSRGSKNYT